MDKTKMDEIELPPGDEYDKQCGEIFLTKKGNIVFHCTLCEKKFSGFYNYFDHVYKRHYAKETEKKKSKESKSSDPTIEIKPDPAAIVEVELLNETMTENGTKLVNELQFDDDNLDTSIEELAELADFSDDDSSDEDYVDDEDDADYEDNKKKKKKKTPQPQTEYEVVGDKLKCPHCEYTTKRKKHMKDHVERHLESNKKFKCTDCDKAFFKRGELISHSRTHTGERPYLCPDCGRGFAKSSSLLEHVRRHKNIRKKECEICHFKFYNAKELRNHRAVHSDARPFVCTSCGKAFKTRLSLKTHTKIHENKQEYECNFCHATFNQSSGLYSHINNKH